MIPTRLLPWLTLLALTAGACNAAVDIEGEDFRRDGDAQPDAEPSPEAEPEGSDGGGACDDQQCPPVTGARFEACEGEVCRYACQDGLDDRNGDLGLREEGDGCECEIDDRACGCETSQEVCDGVDNDCDDLIDADDPGFAAEACDQTLGVCALARERCVEGISVACEERDFIEAAEQAGLSFTPIGALELRCDGADNNCDGREDEQCCLPGQGFRDVLGVVTERLLFPSLSFDPASPLTPLIAYQITNRDDVTARDVGQVRFSVLNILMSTSNANPINPDETFNGETTSPAMAWDGLGHAMVWVRPASDGLRKLIWARLDSSGAILTDTLAVVLQGPGLRLDQVAMGSDGASGVSAVAWVTDDCLNERAETCVKVQGIGAEGQPLAADPKRNFGLNGQVGPPAVAVGTPGFITAWHDVSDDADSNNIQWNIRSLADPALPFLSQITHGLEGIGTFELAAAPERADPAAAFFNGQFVLAFPDEEGGSPVIRVGTIGPDGNLVDHQALPSEDARSITNVRMIVREGQLIVGWVGADESIMTATLDGNYNIVAAPSALGMSQGGRWQFPASSALALGGVPVFGLLTGSSVNIAGRNAESLLTALFNRDGDQLCLQP